MVKPYERSPHFYETDQMAIVHHSNYIRWFEEARIDFMAQVGYGYDKAVSNGVDFAVVSVSCEYRSSVRFGDTVKIVPEIYEVTPSRMRIRYQVTDKATGQLRAVGDSAVCYFDSVKQRPIALKKRLPELYELFCKMCVAE